MKIYHASLNLRILKKYYQMFSQPLNVLISFAVIGRGTGGFLNNRHMLSSIIADSGAWSVAKGKKIDFSIVTLIAYLKLWGHRFDRYFNFDTDFSDHGFSNNWANQQRMEQAGLSPIPVVHNFFNFEIDFYMSLQKYPWLALGSAQSTNLDDFRYAVDRIKWKDSRAKVHWFGGSKYEWLIQTPVASCDTTTWAKTGGYGDIYFWNDQKNSVNKADKIYVGGRLRSNRDDGYHFVTYPWRKDLEEYLANTFGFEYADLLGYDDKFNRQLVNVRFFAELEDRINAERQMRGVPLE